DPPGGADAGGRVLVERRARQLTNLGDGRVAVEPATPRIQAEGGDVGEFFGAAGFVVGRSGGHGGSFVRGGSEVRHHGASGIVAGSQVVSIPSKKPTRSKGGLRKDARPAGGFTSPAAAARPCGRTPPPPPTA